MSQSRQSTNTGAPAKTGEWKLRVIYMPIIFFKIPKFSQNVKNRLTYGAKHYIIYKHELSEETKCGYILTE